jgi:hypothetical protein
VNRSLLLGYAMNVALVVASLLVARGAWPGPDRDVPFLLSQGLLVLLIPAGIVTFRGARRSQGTLRRVLGYSVVGLDLFLAASGLLMAALVTFAGATIVATGP